MPPTLTAYCLTWHLTTSPAFRHLLVEPLAPHVSVQLVAPPDSVTDTDEPPPTDVPVIFCQRLPFASWLRDERARLAWIPMWDQVHTYSQAWWDALPKTLRVVAFSNQVAERAQAAHLPTLHLRYFKPPADFPPVAWEEGPRTLMYWNRTGLVSRSALARLVQAMAIERVWFRPTLDPAIPRAAGYTLPQRLAGAKIEVLPDFMPHAAYLQRLAHTHVYVAPRAVEGVGMVFLEALASGCAVVGADAPTMNEYIEHARTGILIPVDPARLARNDALRTFKRYPFIKRWRRRLVEPFRFKHPIGADQIDVEWLRQVDLPALGDAARQECAAGSAQWNAQVESLARFLLE